METERDTGKYLKDAEESCEQEGSVVVIKPTEEATYKNTVDYSR
jgi:hypothetical protein